jgi:Asp-tRNA(Asn)/Glu-tRNA(Gln) amidotransferase C subunit
MREDVPEPCEIIGDVLAGAPDPDPPYFRVPKVIER